MNILLINVPSRKGRGGFSLPLGLLYVASIIKRSGHVVKLYDPYVDDYDLKDIDLNYYNKLDDIIMNFKPTIIGFGGIATSFGRTKKLSFHINNNYPNIFQIAGGPLSSVYDLLLTKAKIDLVFHGETEISLPIFLKTFTEGNPYFNIEGISFIKTGEVVRTNDSPQIIDLDAIPLPEYHLVDLHKYYIDINNWIEAYRIIKNKNDHFISKIGNKRYYIPIISSRGCTNKCSFCYRHMRGIRQHSVNYVIRHIIFLQQTYGIDGFQFCDELFNSKPDWVLNFCDALEKANLDIFYIIAGARVDKINEKILSRLKETGCIEINYGHESGSDRILKEYGKGINKQMNTEITVLTKKVGLHSPIQLVIASPGETTESIYETIKFLDNIASYYVSLNYLIPLPMTPIWKYVEKKGLIKDVEKFLEMVADNDNTGHINLTKVSDKEWSNWKYLILIQIKLNYMKAMNPILYHVIKPIINLLLKISPSILIAMIKLKLNYNK